MRPSSGFGADGPMADIPGYDLIVQAWGGLMSITGTDGKRAAQSRRGDHRSCRRLDARQIDRCRALSPARKSASAKKSTPRCSKPKSPRLINAGSNYLIGGQIPGRWGNAHPTIVPYQSFQTADSFLVLGAASESIWKRLCQRSGAPSLPMIRASPKTPNRVENRKELIAILAKIFLTRNTKNG